MVGCEMHHATCMEGFATANGCDVCIEICEEGTLEYKECKVFLDCLEIEDHDACMCAKAACAAEVIVCDECEIACGGPCP